MDTRVDWVSFTLPIEDEPLNHHQLGQIASFKLLNVLGENHVILFNGSSFASKPGRAPYRYCLEREDHGCRIYGGSNTETILIELTGRGCDPLGKFASLQSFIAPVISRITRLDLASDILTDCRPSAFANERHVRRFKSITFASSATGETVYVGSSKSDRFARVYRYAHPHPRHPLLRVEHVFRRDLARSAAQVIMAASSYSECAAVFGKAYGWEHPDWQPNVQSDLVVTTKKTSREEAGSIAWLYRQVAPAVRRLWKSGALDLTEWLLYIQGDDETN